jgi:hypothetical protein
MTVDVEAPSGLRKTIDRIRKANKRLAAQNETLVRMVLHQRLRDGDFDWTVAEMILNKYRPDWSNPEQFAEEFTTDAVTAWLASRRGL